MIRRLRRKLVTITMVLLTVVLLAIMICVYQMTSAGLEADSLEALQAAQSELRDFRKGPKDKIRTTVSPCFILEQRPDGTFIALGSSMYDLTDKAELKQILHKAEQTGQHSGVLKEQRLRFLELDAGPGKAYAFMDISSEQDALSQLRLACLMIFTVGLIGIFSISILLARWAVRPVETAWEQQRQFVADASHELKTPLTVILTNAELMADPDYDAASRERFAENILTMSRQMRGLVEELLDQARIDYGIGQKKQEHLDFSKLVEGAVLLFEPVYFEAGRTLESEIQPKLTVNGSSDHLVRVVEVLLDNGRKYSTPDSTVHIHLIRQGKNALLSVSSLGHPLTEQQCKDIFKRFYRADTARTMNRSYGLGLPIAQGIVEQHKGKIWGESKDGWNTFLVTLPLC